jgi:predicted tellurium resistance membrane protein TerC
LAVSVPLIVAGAALIMMLLTHLPFLVWAGAALLGWIAGEVIATDPAVAPLLHRLFDNSIGASLNTMLTQFGLAPRFGIDGTGAEIFCALLGVLIVLIAGAIWRHRVAAELS